MKSIEPSSPLVLLDPFCGSGTIAIEAATMAHGIPPGRLRPPPFQGTRLYDASRWHDLIRDCNRGARNDSLPRVVHGSDRDEGAIAIAAANARRAGVIDAIDLRHCAFSAHPFLEHPDKAPLPLLIASNPPFGRRLFPDDAKRDPSRTSTISPLLPLFQRLSDRLDALVSRPECNAADVSMVLLTDNPSLVQRAFSKWQQDKVLRSNHGGIDVHGIIIRQS
jgi:23S rRNA G2445 N2-methylase RlmL